MKAALRCTTQGSGEQYAVIPLGTKKATWSVGCLDTSKCQYIREFSVGYLLLVNIF